MFGVIFSTATLLHHTHVSDGVLLIPWHGDNRGAIDAPHHTRDIALPKAIQWALFNCNLHTLHHINPKIPYYYWPRARRIVDKAAPGFVNEADLTCFDIGEIIAVHHIFSDQRSTVISFNTYNEIV